MFRNKLSLILATSLSFGLVACDGGDDGEDTGAMGTDSASASESASESASASASASATATATAGETATETATTDDTSDDSSTTDDTSADTGSTTDDTSADPCEGVTCDAGQECVGGICVDTGETESGGEGDPNYTDPADGCMAPNADASDAGLSVCVPPCGKDGSCPDTSVGGMGVCGLGATQTMEGPVCKSDKECDTEAGFTCQALSDGSNRCFQQTHCLPVCTMSAECPEGMTCDMGTGLCLY